jgi:hypothetical protein
VGCRHQGNISTKMLEETEKNLNSSCV